MDISTAMNRLAVSTVWQNGATVSRLELGSDESDPAKGQSAAPADPGNPVRISGPGQALSASNRASQEAGKNDDIDSSSLPDEIKQVLKMIREIKARLREQQQALAEAMSDQSLGDEARKARLAKIQTTIGSLSSALTSATMTLSKLMGSMSLTDTQKTEVAALVSK